MQQADQTAAYLARQGLGGSGINISANSSLNSNRSSLESQAALKSQDLARELQRRSLLDSFSTKAMGMSTVLQNKGIDVNSVIAQMQMNEQMKMFEEQMQAQADAGTGSFLGSIFNGAAMVGAAAIMSDERMKTNVIRTGVEVVPGVPVAFFQWKNGDKKWHAGVIAQDVQKVMPEAVIERNGLLMVDYGMLRNRSL
jgi:nitrogen fixation/metabolism regulation signal transduction histidine kinase